MTEKSDNVTPIERAREKAKAKVKTDTELTVAAQSAPDPNSLAALRMYRPWRGMEWHNWHEHADQWGIPPACPVVPLGLDGEKYYIIDSSGNLQQMKPKDFGRNELASLFNRYPDYPKWFWPKTKEATKQTAQYADAHNMVPTGEFHAERVRDSMMKACAEKSLKGQWNIEDKLRGTGAWVHDDGQLILHLGSYVLVGGQKQEAGEIGSFYYPRSATIIGPSADVANPGQRLLKYLSSWNTRRDDLDPHIMLGWIMSAMAGGALDHRPGLYLSGPKGTGKSTLMSLIRMVMGGMAFHSADTTAAGIRQSVGQKSIPVLIDEAAEAKADNRAARSLFELFRIAFDGSKQNRGSADHKAMEFRVRSSFLFASINRVGMTGQDRSRMAFVNLLPLSPGAPEPQWEERDLREIGQGLLARWQQNWGHYRATYTAFYNALREIGHEARSATVFGVLAASCHLALHDGAPESIDIRQWSDWLMPDSLAELTSVETDSDLCIQHMMTKTTRAMEKWSGGRTCVADVLNAWDEYCLWKPGASGDNTLTADGVNKHLHPLGLALIKPKPFTAPDDVANSELFVSSNLPGTEDLFAGTHWGDNGGGQGTWVGALQNIGPQNTDWKEARARIAGRQVRGIRIRLSKVIDLESESEDRLG